MLRNRFLIAMAIGLLGATTVRAQEATGPNVALIDDAKSPDKLHELEEYWVGVAVGEPEPALRAQLGLPAEAGVVVDNVAADSPAKKAGIETYDVIVKANDKTVKDARNLIELINQAKQSKLTLDVIRKAKHRTITVTPEKRPASVAILRGSKNGLEEMQRIEALLRETLPGMKEGKPLEFRLIHPGQILPPGAPLPPGANATFNARGNFKMKMPLADGYEVEIERHGDKPAKVTVTHDKEKWEAAEGDLSKIPEKVRPQVENLLHSHPFGMRVLVAPGMSPASGPNVFFAPGMPGAAGIELPSEKRLKEMDREIEQLRKAVDELRSKAGLPALSKPTAETQKKSEEPKAIEY